MSRSPLFLLLLCLALIALFTPKVFAQDAEEMEIFEDEDDDDVLGLNGDEEYEEYGDEYDEDVEYDGVVIPHPDVKTTFFFPKRDSQDSFPFATVTEVLISFQNNADQPFNVTRVGGSLHSPFDYNYHIQNFSNFDVSVIVPAGQEATLHYAFMTSELEPVEFLMSTWVEYNDSMGHEYHTTVMNNSITLTVPDTPFDFVSLFSYVIGAAFLFGAYVFMTQNEENTVPVPVASESSKSATESAGWDDIAIYKQKTTVRKSKKKENNIERERYARSWTLQPAEDYVEPTKCIIWCTLDGCDFGFKTLAEHNSHYQMIHCNVCRVCKLVFNSNRLLEIHILERHDDLFKLMSGERMFQCLVEGCKQKFKSRHGRRLHLIDKHKYPENFVFDKRKSKTQQKHKQQQHNKKEMNTKKNNNNKQNKLNVQENQNKDIMSDDNIPSAKSNKSASFIEVEPNSDSDEVMLSAFSRLTVSRRIPKSISFGRRR